MSITTEFGVAPQDDDSSEHTTKPAPADGGVNPRDSGTPGPYDEPVPNPAPVPQQN